MNLKFKKISYALVTLFFVLSSGCTELKKPEPMKPVAKPDAMVLQLQSQLTNTGITVKRIKHTNTFQLTLPAAISFGKNNAVLLPRFYKSLDAVAEVLKNSPTTLAKISGHTDIYGTLRYNQILSEKRANSIANYLAFKGIWRNRLQTAGYGITKPKASNKSRQGRAQNRRVEILLYTL